MATDKNQKKKTPGASAADQAKNAHDQVENAHDQAEKDMQKDPELSDPDPTDDLDEGELAIRDNSDEKALDSLERPRPRKKEGDHSGKGKEK